MENARPSNPDDVNIDALLSELGTALHKQSGHLDARPPRPETLIRTAKEWIENQREEIGKLIHANPKLKKIAYDERDKQTLIAALIDILTGYFGGIPIAALATLIVHYGLDHFVESPDADSMRNSGK